MIEYLKERKTWLLHGRHTTYALGVTPSGLVVHLYFGVSLPRKEDYPLPSDFPIAVPFSGTEENSCEEYPGWGGLRYTEPSLKASQADGARDLLLHYEEFSLDDDELIVRLSDSVRSLTVELSYRMTDDVMERSARITNTGPAAATLEEVLSGAFTLPDAADYRLTDLVGRWGAETQLERTLVGRSMRVLESRRGHTSHGANPWWALDADGTASEDRGEVYAATLAYSGNWKAVIQMTPAGQLRMSAGIHDFDFAYRLEPGTSFTSPNLLITFSAEGFGGASRNLHDHIRRRVLPENHRDELRPVLYNSWEATKFDVDEAGQIALAEIAAELGIELFVIDDGWFGRRNSDNAGLGDWFVNKDKFPNGLEAVAGRVHELGMKFGLWVEPEMVNPDSDLYRSHPDWVYRFPGREPAQMRNQLILNLGREDVQGFIIEFMDRLLSGIEIDFIKWDMNRTFSDAGDGSLPRDRQKEVWVRHVEGLYRVVEEIRRRHPAVLIEDCSGGGGRVDPGILHYYDQVWVSDNTDALDRLFIQEGYSFAYPANTMVSWVTAAGGFLEQRTVPLAFRFHSAMTGVLGVGDDITAWTEEERTTARGLIALYKEIRPVVQQGDQYRILSPREQGLSALLYVAKDRSEALLFAFLSRNHFRNPLPVIRLQGLDPEAVYEVELPVTEGTSSPLIDPQPMSGSALRRVGLRLDLRREYESVVLRLFRRT